MRRLLVTVCVMLVMALATHGAHAGSAVNVTPDGIAIDGYDTVAYFTQGEAAKGDPAFSHEWNGATWHFANAENRDRFIADPEAYAPQFGGWCAYALSVGEYAAEVDPAAAWRVVDDKLYLNWDEQVQRQWTSGMDARITRGAHHWETVQVEVADGTATFSRKPDSPWHGVTD